MISTKGRYALSVMIDIAEQNKDSYIPLKDIADRQKISKKYLEIIVKKLVDAKLLTGASGKNGGYKLVKSPSKYTLLEILETTEGSLSPVSCISKSTVNCERKRTCKTLPLWIEYYDLISSFLKKKKLKDLIIKKNKP